MEKNEKVTVDVLDIGQDGEGIGRISVGPDAGFTVFVKDTVPGDQAEVLLVKVKKRFAYGRLIRVIHPSSDRQEAACPMARQCGGCQLQAMKPEAQAAMKMKKVTDDLERIGGFENAASLVRPIRVPEKLYRYRNKTIYPIAEGKDGRPTAGFFAGRTHSVIPCEDCLLAPEENKIIRHEVLGWMEDHHIRAFDERTGKGLVRHLMIRKGFATGEILVCLVINGHKIPAQDDLVQRLRQVPGMTGITYSSNTERTNVVLTGNTEVLWGRGYVTDILRPPLDGTEVMYHISPRSFYQVNHDMTERLYQEVLEDAGLTGQETVMDLYCGIGTISLFLARKAERVIGVEIVPEAVRDARQNAELNGIGNAEFFAGRAEEVVPRLYRERRIHADVVVVDPPRKGCDRTLLDTIIRMNPEKAVYVSCDPATLARDLRILADGGFQVKKVQPYENFFGTVHVETVCLLSQRKPDTTIEVDLDISELEVSSAETKATYEEIKSYVLEKFGLKVSNLYIAQVKRECGIVERINYNLPKTEGNIVPQCPEDKRKAIKDAFIHFQMI